jgi:hypothetical protein
MTPRLTGLAAIEEDNASRLLEHPKKRTVEPEAKPKPARRPRFPSARREPDAPESSAESG